MARRLLITGSAVRVRPREPFSRLAALFLGAACLAFGPLSRADDYPIDRICTFPDTEPMTCVGLFEADVVFDSNPEPLTLPAGQGFMRLGYHDSYTGKWVEILSAHYSDRFLTSYPQPRTLLLVQNPDWIGTGGFEGEYRTDLR